MDSFGRLLIAVRMMSRVRFSGYDPTDFKEFLCRLRWVSWHRWGRYTLQSGSASERWILPSLSKWRFGWQWEVARYLVGAILGAAGELCQELSGVNNLQRSGYFFRERYFDCRDGA